MQSEAILQAISNVGFPIVCAIGVAWFCKYLVDKYTSIITETMTKLSDSIDELKDELKKLKGE